MHDKKVKLDMIATDAIKDDVKSFEFMQLLKCRLFVEHEYLCLRNESDFLVWYHKLTKLERGMEFGDIIKHALKMILEDNKKAF